MTDVYGDPLGGSDAGLCALKQRRRVYAYHLGEDGLGPLGEVEEALVATPLHGVRIHQVEEVSRIGVFVAAEYWAFVLQGAHWCVMRACAVRVAAVVFYGYTLWICPLADECPFRRGCFIPLRALGGLGVLCDTRRRATPAGLRWWQRWGCGSW